jgi:hypothetical protein
VAACIPRSYKGQDEARKHGMASTEGKSYASFWIRLFGFYIAGILIFCFYFRVFYINQSGGGSLGIVIVVFASFLASGDWSFCFSPYTSDIYLYTLLFFAQ